MTFLAVEEHEQLSKSRAKTLLSQQQLTLCPQQSTAVNKFLGAFNSGQQRSTAVNSSQQQLTIFRGHSTNFGGIQQQLTKLRGHSIAVNTTFKTTFKTAVSYRYDF
jgi:hypothetical protein